MDVLTIDTSCPSASVGLVRDGQVVAERWNHEQVKHAERLGSMIKQVLDEAGVRWRQVDLLSVCKGPGSFTGVRVGMATAKGIAMATKIPVVGVVSLEAMAWRVFREKREARAVMALLDARKDELFVACYGREEGELFSPDHIRRDGAEQWVETVVARVGRSGLWGTGEPIEACPQPCSLTDTDWRAASVRALGVLGAEQWQRAKQDEIEILEPLYVRPPDITKPKNSTQ